MGRITGLFDTRREREMAIERLVQDRGFDRQAITVMPEQHENSAGSRSPGADAKRAEPVTPARTRLPSMAGSPSRWRLVLRMRLPFGRCSTNSARLGVTNA